MSVWLHIALHKVSENALQRVHHKLVNLYKTCSQVAMYLHLVNSDEHLFLQKVVVQAQFVVLKFVGSINGLLRLRRFAVLSSMCAVWLCLLLAGERLQHVESQSVVVRCDVVIIMVLLLINPLLFSFYIIYIFLIFLFISVHC